MMFEDQIEYECVGQDHRSAPIETGREVTIYNGCWAHCPAGADGGHHWLRVRAREGAISPGITT